MKILVTALMVIASTLSTAASVDGPLAEGQHAQTVQLDVGGKTVQTRLQLYLPAGYQSDPGKKWPLIIFLHGSGERGDDVHRVKANGPPKLLQNRSDFPFIVASPQADSNARWEADRVIALLDSLLQSLPIDADRVYLTGLSLGALGTWQIAAASPTRFAAIAPVCGWGNTADACAIKSVPVWAFHGEADSVVPFAAGKAMADAVAACGGEVSFTGYPGVDHDSWTPTYDNPALYEWLLKHKRTATAPQAGKNPSTDK